MGDTGCPAHLCFLTALTNDLAALAHVMTAEVAVAQAGSDTGYRHEVWRAAGTDAEGIMILLHYTALVDLGVMGAAEALRLLLEVCTVRSLDDPRADAVTTNLPRASDQLAVAAERIDTLFAAARDVASIIPAPLP